MSLALQILFTEMAGNIIPAIATTNAIIAGVIVLQALQLLRKNYTGLRNVHLQRKPEVPLNSCTIGLPPKTCAICRDTYTDFLCDPEKTTLSEAVNGLLGSGEGESDGTGPRDVSVYEDKRLLADPDFDDNMERSLASLGVTTGKFLTIVDEDGKLSTVAAAIGSLPCVVHCPFLFFNSIADQSTRSDNHPPDGPSYVLPSPLPIPGKLEKPQPAASAPPSTPSRKRNLEDDDVVEDLAPPAKRSKANSNVNNNISSPSKKRKFEEDGILMLEAPDEKIDDADGAAGAVDTITIED